LNFSVLAPLPRITIITVVRNDVKGLERTLASVVAQDYENFQLVVVDGGSTDGTLKQAHEYAAAIDVLVSEPDEGIYHAMNKGILIADGEWLLFMNSGDEFVSPQSLSAAVAATGPEVEVVYTDWIYREEDKIVKADFDRMNVRHQSVMYRKSLHDVFGIYAVGKGVTISDFLFFLSIANKNWRYSNHPIAICDKAGASGKPMHFYQRMAVEFLFARRSRIELVLILLLHPFYRLLKRHLAFKR
jgi:glycosyltransferase involved in cell wall biosynthesis